MNGQDPTRGRPTRARFDFGNVIGDPFALATVSIAFLAWLISLIAAAFTESQANRSNAIPKFIWWSITYEFCVVVGVAMSVAFDSVHNYQVAIVGFLAPVLVFASSAVNSLVYDKRPSAEAAAAGQILMCMIAIIWIFYFGSSSNASSRTYMDQFSVHKDQKGSSMRPYPGYRPETASSHHQNPVYSQRLSGLETSSPVSQQRNPTDSFAQMASVSSPAGAMPAGAGAGSTTNGQPGGQPEEIVPPTEYPYRAKAIYNYTANPEDANEISFSKHEILEVSDVSGRWWQARKTTGETGIAPSNYLILL